MPTPPSNQGHHFLPDNDGREMLEDVVKCCEMTFTVAVGPLLGNVWKRREMIVQKWRKWVRGMILCILLF